MPLSILKIAALLLHAALLQSPAEQNGASVAWDSNVVEAINDDTAVLDPVAPAGTNKVPTLRQTGQPEEQFQDSVTSTSVSDKPVPADQSRYPLVDSESATPWGNSSVETPSGFASTPAASIKVVDHDIARNAWGEKFKPKKRIAEQASFEQEIIIREINPRDLHSQELDQIEPADINDPQLMEGQPLGIRQKSIAAYQKPAFPKARRENPRWWIHALQQPLLAQRQALPTNIDDVMFLALRNSPQVQILNSRPIIQQTFVGEADAQFDWTQFVETTWNETDEPVGSSLTTGNQGRFFEREWALDAGMRRQLRNGGTFSFTQRYGTLDNNSDFLDPPNQANSQLFLDYRQPLLRDRGRSVNMSQVALASLDFDAVSGESRTELQEYLVSVVRSYWNVYFRRASLVINRRGLQRGEELLRQLRLRDGIDVRNDQLLRAEAAVAARRSDVIRAEYELVNAQDELINVSVGPKYLAGTPEQVEFMPVAFDLPLGIQFDPTTVAQSALYNRPEVQQSIAELRAAAVRNHVSQNQILPRLDAVLTTTVNGLRGDKDVGGAFSDQFSAGNPSYSAGFEFEIPVGNRAAQYRAERARMEMSLAHQEFESQVGDVLVDARISSREVSRLNSENQNNWSALMKANEELFLIQERQRLQLDDGKVGSLYIEDLLASQARLTAAEIRLAQSQTEQAVALVDLKRAVGVLVSGGQRAARPVTFAPSFMPNAQAHTAEWNAWPSQPQFDPQVQPVVAIESASTFPVQQAFQPNMNVGTLPQMQFDSRQFESPQNTPGWQPPAADSKASSYYPLPTAMQPIPNKLALPLEK